MKINLKETSINQQLKDIYAFFMPEAEQKGIQLSLKACAQSKKAIINTDCEKLFAIVTNLVKNAIKYSKSGEIELGYDIVKDGHSTNLRFFVKDSGMGIPVERQRAIFERFIQADIADKMALQGAGLGLAISKSYVEMLGGKIWVESQEGKGSIFYFTIPYPAETLEKNSLTNKLIPEKSTIKVNNLKVLIAEDDEISEMFLSLLIKEFCCDVLIAQTGFETVEICRNNPDIDLILMDIRMPDLNGYEATKQIRQFNKTVVIIAQTAFGLSGDREKAILSGCNDYITKPIKKYELLAIINKYF
jgi:CheY-like chemotaxis protein